MALDGAFLRYIKKELETHLIGARIDKIFQPNKHEFIFSFRNKTENFKLLISSRASSSRIHLTENALENPKTPFMLCMLFRKKLSGAKLVSITQKNLERALYLKFEATDELGDKINLTLAVEIMGQYSNIILIDQNNKIIDAIKRVDLDMSSKRQVLPGLQYSAPPPQDKICLLNCNIEKLAYSIYEKYRKNEIPLHQIILENLQGFSKIICKELEYKILKGHSSFHLDDLKKQLINLQTDLSNYVGQPIIIAGKKNQFIDFSCLPLHHCNENFSLIYKDSFSELLDLFFYEKDKCEHIKNSSQNFIRILKNEDAKLKKKIKIQEKELLASKGRECFKEFADLISANSYKIKRGMVSVTVENFYDPDLKSVDIKLAPALDAHQNAQRYYKKYSKLKNAESVLTQEIEKAKSEIEYIDTLLDEISRAESISELSEIKNELISQGYIKEKKSTKKDSKPLAPIQAMTTTGFKVSIGRNNTQNDKLTLKVAKKNDIWLHVKDCPGSHTIIHTEGKDVAASTILEAANLAALHSKCKNSSNVAVDYTLVKYVKKPIGAKPGMAIYTNYKTVYVTPQLN